MKESGDVPVVVLLAAKLMIAKVPVVG